MGLTRHIYKDLEGRQKVVLLPEGAPESDVDKGILVGPPPLDDLNLPIEVEVRLNNELFARGILEGRDVLRKRQEVQYAIQAALRLDVERVIGAYVGREYRNARSEPAEDKPDAPVHHRRPRQPRKPASVPVSGAGARS